MTPLRAELAVAALASGALIAGCSPKTEPPASERPSAPVAPASQALQAEDRRNPLGDGSAMTGSVSGLTGTIQGFQVEETATAFIVELAADVLFAFDKADLAPGATPQLQKTAEVIRRSPSGDIQVIGYTDSKGDDAYNLDLSLRRARAVVAWLSTTGGVPGARLTPEGRGEADPVAPNAGSEGNDYPEGRAMNRRVTVVVPKG